MSCFICDDETISALVKAFDVYDVIFTKDDFRSDSMKYSRYMKLKMMGQFLLEENIKAYNRRYGGQLEGHERKDFNLKGISINEGIVYGCVRCYNYQLLELPEWESSDIFYSLERLQLTIVKRLLDRCGQEMFWGYPNEFNKN